MTEYPGQQAPEVIGTEYNSQQYLMERVLAKVTTATLVKVGKAKSNGEVAVAGVLDVTPMVNMIDGRGTNYKHGTVHNLIYFRMQSGTKAIIMDPVVGDRGLAVIADRDISAVKKTRNQGPPGSYRRFDMADGVFFPCVLGDSPTSYIQFQSDGTIVLSPDNGTTVVTIKAGKVQVSMGSLKFSLQPSRMDLNCDFGAGTNHVMSDTGPIGNVYCIP